MLLTESKIKSIGFGFFTTKYPPLGSNGNPGNQETSTPHLHAPSDGGLPLDHRLKGGDINQWRGRSSPHPWVPTHPGGSISPEEDTTLLSDFLLLDQPTRQLIGWPNLLKNTNSISFGRWLGQGNLPVILISELSWSIKLFVWKKKLQNFHQSLERRWLTNFQAYIFCGFSRYFILYSKIIVSENYTVKLLL